MGSEIERNRDKILALRVRWREWEREREHRRGGGERERDRFLSYLDPSPFTEGLYEARSLPVSTLKLQIPPRFVDRMAVSYSCKAKLHSAVRALTRTHTHARTHTHTHTHSHTLLERHIRAQMNTVSTHLSFREREKTEKPLVLFLERGQINRRRRLKKTLKLWI